MNSDSQASELIAAWLDGEATPEQITQLRAWLAQDREHIRTFVRETHAHRSLREFAIADQAQNELQPMQQKSAVKPASRRLWLAAGLAACLAIGIGIYYFLQPPAIALADVSGNVFIKRGSQSLPAAAGFVLQSDDVVNVPTSASAAVVFGSDRTRVDVKQNTDLTIQPGNFADSASAGKMVLLSRGEIDAVVAKQPAGHPFILETPRARATVVGTKFSLNADKDSSRLDVGEGRVQFALHGSVEALDVSAGGYACFDPGTTSFSNAVRVTANGSQHPRVVDDHEGELLWHQPAESVPAAFEHSTEQAHGGKKSLRIAYQLKAGDEDPYTQLLHPFALRRGEHTLRFAIFVVSSDAKANWNIQFRLGDRSCWMLNFGFFNALKPGWNEIELDLQQPPLRQAFGDPATPYAPLTADCLIFSICNGSATIFLDDFEVVGGQ